MPLRVLLIEDNPGDVYIIQEALSQSAECQITVVEDGDRAFRHLEQLSAGGSLPELIVLDLNLPGKDGIELLNLIRSTARLSGLPVAVVSSSPKDVMARKAAHADCYITKPTDLDAYMAIGGELVRCARP